MTSQAFQINFKVSHYIDIVWNIHQLFPLIFPVSIYIEKYNCEVGRFLKKYFYKNLFFYTVLKLAIENDKYILLYELSVAKH